jgi:hypothetical protein
MEVFRRRVWNEVAAEIQMMSSTTPSVLPAKLALIGVNNHDRQLAQNLVEIRLRVVDAIDQRRHDHQDKHPAESEHTLPFDGESARNAWAIGGQHRLRHGPAAQASSDSAQPPDRQQLWLNWPIRRAWLSVAPAAIPGGGNFRK